MRGALIFSSSSSSSFARFCAGQKNCGGSGLLKMEGGDALQQPFYIFTNKGKIQWQMNDRRVTDPIQTGAGRGFRAYHFRLDAGFRMR